ncbi:MAG: Tol-Pal system beta propeller repeat protein TolB [Endomicrobia bacterium]|nr:Tol-Pal system beta propeller repeat protein TolB [Endomicrobiia bacterium]MDW8055958.1 Tol-Pal system beta propeller repeat protein TolB [Elusimicrobiota bacterium]
MKNIFCKGILVIVLMNPIFCGIDVYIQAIKTGQRIDVGISKFVTKDVKLTKVASDIQQVVKNDLLFTRLFNVIEPGWQYLPNKIVSERWQKYGIDVVICAEITQEGGKYILEGIMYDIANIEKIYQEKFVGNDIRYVSHLFSDHIVRVFTGEYGIATTQIVFVNDMTGNKEIYKIDYDGYNLQQLTNNKSINIYPRVSPDGKKIVYTSYCDRNPDLYIMDSDGKNQQPLSVTQGLNVTANWSPDATQLILTMTKAKHAPNLYIFDINTKTTKRLTFGGQVDISGYFSPNGREIVFVSNRSGLPQLYIASVDGSNVRRLPTSEYSSSPVWSPKGDKIAFTMRTDKGLFDIFLYDIAKGDYYRLTYSEGSNESPFFSPDGRFIVFVSNRNHRWELYTMFIDGSNQRRITELKGNSFTPCWAPRRI